jgi:hypothetical protein
MESTNAAHLIAAGAIMWTILSIAVFIIVDEITNNLPPPV